VFDAELLRLLACPVCHGDLTEGASSLDCARCAKSYPVVDGIPHLIAR